jgi:hypothetical protein
LWLCKWLRWLRGGLLLWLRGLRARRLLARLRRAATAGILFGERRLIGLSVCSEMLLIFLVADPSHPLVGTLLHSWDDFVFPFCGSALAFLLQSLGESFTQFLLRCARSIKS